MSSQVNPQKAFYSASGNVVELDRVWFSYNGKDYALRDIGLMVKKSSWTAILGPSGSGKTTLLKIIAGLLTPSRGKLRIFDADCEDGQYPSALKRCIGYIPQQLGLIRNLTVLENVLIGALPRIGILHSLLGIFPEEIVRSAEENLRIVGIEDKMMEKVHRLSGGERRRVAIVRALMQRPAIVLADELTSDLDYETAHNIMNALEEVRKHGATLIMATHHIDLALDYCDNIVLIRGGAKVAEVKASELNVELVRRL